MPANAVDPETESPFDRRWHGAVREPSLAELLADPVMRALMTVDGVTPGEIRLLAAAARRHLGARPR